mgnify:CR=1 FL=1
MKIEDMNTGQTARISKIDLSHPSSFRLLEYGFTPGQEIKLMNKSFFNDPLAVSLRGALIAIRKSDADCIEITL